MAAPFGPQPRQNNAFNFEKWYDEINPALFTKENGGAIVFHFKMEDIVLKGKLEKLVHLGGGYFVKHISDMDSQTALILDDLNTKKVYKRPSFKLSYIFDCIEQNELLDISCYLHNEYYEKSNFFMNVLYRGSEEFRRESTLASSSCSVIPVKPPLNTQKHTRGAYTIIEKESILKFILQKPYRRGGLGGDTIWRTMELRNVCPRRTYQSMKNHFRKTLIHELDRFEFLTEKDIKYLKGY